VATTAADRTNYGYSRGELGPITVSDSDGERREGAAMRYRDIYDDMPDGAALRRHNQKRLAELEREGAARRARIERVLSQAKLDRLIVQPLCLHTL
jgi:hypothetical protein